MSRITIIPRKGSRKFNQDLTVRYYDTPEDELNDNPSNIEEYKDEFWGGTEQAVVPIFWWNLSRFKLIDPFDIERKRELTDNSEEFNKLVAQCKLRYPTDYPDQSKVGKVIEECDIFDMNDPFLRNEKLEFVLDEGSGGLDPENPLNKIMICIALGQDEFALGGTTNNGPLSSKVRWLIVDMDIDRKLKKKEREVSMQVSKRFAEVAKSYNLMLKINLLLGLTTSVKDNNKEDLEEALYNYVNSEGTILNGFKTKKEHFLEISEKESLLNSNYLFYLGLNEGIIKRKDRVYQSFGVVLGKTKEESVSFLTEPHNQEVTERIEIAIKKVTGELEENKREIPSEKESEKPKTTKRGRPPKNDTSETDLDDLNSISK